ncbi:MAG TPA: MMPL family transporter, partial [Bacillota bacterium]|nr:MMPL family transporter [Bacillota bacterium]
SVFRWQIGAFKPTILSVLPAAIGSIWTFGIIGFLGNEISILTAVVPIFIIVIGSADGLHFTSHFQEALMEGLNRREAMTRTLKVVGIPMIITTLTSMAGFLSLLSIDTSSIIDLSVFATVGIFLAGIATWYVLPLILSNDIDVLPKHHKEKKINISKGLKKVWGLPSLVATLLLIIVSAFFIPNINNEFNMLSLYKSYTVVSKNAEKLQEVNGGSIPLYIEIEPDDQVISLASLDQVDQFVSQLESLEEVDHIMNPYRMLEILYNMQYDGDIPSNFVLQAIYQNVSLAEDNIFNNMVNVDENKIRLLVFPSNMENATLGVIEDQVDSSGIKANITGVQYLLRDLNVSISSMQINSILL